VTTAVGEPRGGTAGVAPGAAPMLEVDDLRVEFRSRKETAKVLNGVSYHVNAGETLAVLGESGSGKSVTAQTIMGILETPPGKITGGEVRFEGRNMLTMSAGQRRKLRAERIAMIFQDALSSLNPLFTVGFQIGEVFRKRRGMSRRDSKQRAGELMDLVKIPNARNRVGSYPHEFSGGMRQRVMIAMSLALNPDVLIADEPTTALDVTVQAQIMDLLAELRAERNMAMILITHDLGVVAGVADRIAVMYAGRIVEHAPVHELYAKPCHPYTMALMNSIPRLDQKGETLRTIEGLPPNLAKIPPGCPFHPRCQMARDVCRGGEVPDLVELGNARASACHFAKELAHRD
jgi:oligopeptide/dipeptide ABC transporter ATP-binding protein